MADNDGPSGTVPAQEAGSVVAQLERARTAFHDVNNSLAIILTNWWVLREHIRENPRPDPEVLAIAVDVDLAANRLITQIDALRRVLDPWAEQTAP